MKCRQCDNESVYDDGLCEVCHRRAITEEATVMSDSERDNFRGQTIDEDGNIYNDLSEERAYGGRSKERIHIYAARGLPLRVKAALALIVFLLLPSLSGSSACSSWHCLIYSVFWPSISYILLCGLFYVETGNR